MKLKTKKAFSGPFRKKTPKIYLGKAPQPNHLPRWRGLLAVRCPSFHQPSPFIQHIAPPICSLRRVPNDVTQGSFRNFPREVGLLRAPVPKAGPEAVDRDAARNLSQHRSLP